MHRQHSYVLTRQVNCFMHSCQLSKLGKRFYDQSIPFRHRGLLLHSLNDHLQVCEVQIWLLCQPQQQMEVCQPHLIWLTSLLLEVMPQLCFPCTSKTQLRSRLEKRGKTVLPHCHDGIALGLLTAAVHDRNITAHCIKA